MVAVLRRFLSALHYVDHGRQSFKNAKLALSGMKDSKAKKQLNFIITEADVAYKILEERLAEIMPKVDAVISVDFDQFDEQGV